MASSEIELEDVELYLEEVRQIPLLSAQEFHTLLLRAADGDEDAQLELVNANLRLVVNIARNYVGQGASFPDLIQEGNIGLMKAVKKFSTKASATFIEYAEECIESAIVNGLREMNPSAQVSLDTPIDEDAYNVKDEYAVEGDFVEGLTLGDFVEDNKTPTHFDRVNYSQMTELLGRAHAFTRRSCQNLQGQRCYDSKRRIKSFNQIASPRSLSKAQRFLLNSFA